MYRVTGNNTVEHKGIESLRLPEAFDSLRMTSAVEWVCGGKKTQKTVPSSLPGYRIWHNVCWYKKLEPLLSKIHLYVWGPLRCSAANKGRRLLSECTGHTGERQGRERMATLVERADMEALGGQSNTGTSPTSSGPAQHFNDGRFYLLVVIGEVTSEDHLKCAIADIEKGKMELIVRWV